MNDIFSQIFDKIDIGLVVIDKNLKVCHWNRWMELHSGVSADKIIGSSIFDFYKGLNKPGFLRNCKSVFTFGNSCFLSYRFHHYLFPFAPLSAFESQFSHMQQNCTIGPLRDVNNSIEYIFISVQDATEIASYESGSHEEHKEDKYIKDELTGVYNREHLKELIKKEIERHKESRKPLSLIMLDLDSFRTINDAYGHKCSDFILKSVASTIERSIRSSDILARHGGEEFCLLLPETPIETASTLADLLENIISKTIYQYQEIPIKITVSMGVTELSGEMDCPEALLNKVEECLNEEKKLVGQSCYQKLSNKQNIFLIRIQV